MKRYRIEWTEVTAISDVWTRDAGWTDVEANSPEEARTKFVAEYGHTKRIHAFHEIRPRMLG